MPVRIADDELLPIEYYDIRLDADHPFFCAAQGVVLDHQSAPEHADEVDLIYVASGDGRTLLASPGALSDTDVYGENALQWGGHLSYFRLTELTSDDFDGLVDFRLLDFYFNKGEEVELPEPFEDGTHLFYPGQGELVPDSILAFYGAFGATGLLRVKSVDGSHIFFDIKIQPTE